MTTTVAPLADVATPPDSVTIHQLRQAIARIWRPFALGAVIGALVGVIILALLPTFYTSFVRVWVRDAPVSLDPGVNNQRNLSIDTEAQRVTSVEVARRSGIAVGPDEPVKAIALTAPVNSKILQIRVTAESPEVAQQAAAAVGAAFLEVRRQYQVTRRDAAVARLDRQADRISRQVVKAPNSVAAESWRLALDEVIARREDVASVRTGPGSIIARPSTAVPLTKNPTVLPVSLAIVGGAVALIVATWRAWPKEAEK